MTRFHGRPGYSVAHFERLANGGPDVPGAAAERVALRMAGERAHAEMLARFGALSPANAQEAVAWQGRRQAELGAQLAALVSDIRGPRPRDVQAAEARIRDALGGGT